MISDKVNCVTKDYRGFYWIGTSKGLYKFDPANSKIKKASIKNSDINLESFYINSIYVEKNNSLWIGTGRGLIYFSQSENTVQHYLNDEKDKTSLLNDNIYAVAGDDNDNIFIATEKGLAKFDKKNKKFINFNKASDNSRTNGLISCAIKDSKGYIWVGTMYNYGLNRYNPANGKVEHFYCNDYDSTSIKGKIVSCVFEDSKKQIWIGTDKGLFRFCHTFKVW
ncbi:MAG: hypothetical protein HY738_06265 [Bacteroidia bacterium]|nr:hypothetical protein [Bacteroidia bacterium]